MARLTGGNDNTVVQIRAFLGLNENPDGETTLKIGEFSRMWNFRITQDKHLQKRPGTKEICRIVVQNYWEQNTGDTANLLRASKDDEEFPEVPPVDPGDDIPVNLPVVDPVTREKVHLFGVWSGLVMGKTHTLANYDGRVYDFALADATTKSGTATLVGQCAPAYTSFFPFDGKVYLMDGKNYMVWDGGEGQFRKVVGYIPTVLTATTPGGAGTRLENVNRLNGKRRVEFSPDGTAKNFQLPEKYISEVIGVTLDGETVTGYTADTSAGVVTLSSVPPEGTNTLTVTYRKGDGARDEVTAMRYAELFNGAADTRVFLYGDGSNRAIYSGVEYQSGKPSAEYFPDLFEVAVGESNTPVTALVRHYSRLMAYKTDSAWVITAGGITTESGRYTPAFYVSPVNRQFGNEAMGQVKLLENDPLTMDARSVYQWHNANGYISNSENNVKCISDRVAATLRGFNISLVRTVNMKKDHEFWIFYGNSALIYNYTNDTWYFYKDLKFNYIVEVGGEVYGFANDGDIVHVSRAYRDDCGKIIDCYAETGAMDFGRDWQLKYSPMLFVAIRPENHARITVTVESNRRSGYPEKLVSANLSTFNDVDFGHFSFITNRKPQVRRLKIKVKKAAFYQIIYKSNDKSATSTVIETDVQLRFAGNVK